MAKKILYEVCLIRLVLIVLLVLYHSFAPFCGVWNPISGVTEYPEAYWWIGKAAYSIMLECFTFISGWVFGFQYLLKGSGANTFSNIIYNKFKRLIIPSIIFSLIYILLYEPVLFSKPQQLVISVLEGYGHMWFLPMLFWCFLGIILIERTKIKPLTAIIILSVLYLLSFIKIPLRLSYTMQYMIFFYGGYLIGREKIDLKRYLTPKYIYICILAYLVIFLLIQSWLIPFVQEYKSQSMEIKLIGNSLIRVLHLCYAWFGTLGLSLFCMYAIHKLSISVSNFWIRVSTYTFGIYLFQQFILIWLYYHTNMAEEVSYGLLPWFAFVVTLVLSYLLTILMRSNRFGRLLIG